jgi:hypothetical protein
VEGVGMKTELGGGEGSTHGGLHRRNILECDRGERTELFFVFFFLFLLSASPLLPIKEKKKKKSPTCFIVIGTPEHPAIGLLWIYQQGCHLCNVTVHPTMYNLGTTRSAWPSSCSLLSVFSKRTLHRVFFFFFFFFFFYLIFFEKKKKKKK